ncbi:MAG: hypothetical protein AB7O66_24730 [Limisphaerales bacterium]
MVYSPGWNFRFASASHSGNGDAFSRVGEAPPSDLALDRDGNVVLVGETHSVDLPTTPDALQPGYAGGSAFGSGHGFIARFTPDGSRLLHCSYLGGQRDDEIVRLALDASGNFSVVGQTDSKDLPVLNAIQHFAEARSPRRIHRDHRGSGGRHCVVSAMGGRRAASLLEDDFRLGVLDVDD